MTQALAVRLSTMPAEERSSFLDGVLEDFQTKTIEEIAKSRNLDPSTLYRYLVKEKDQEYRALRAAKAMVEYDSAEAELRTADDMLKLNKAERRIRSAQWLLERLERNLYGDKQEDQGPKYTLCINIGRPQNGQNEKEVQGNVINGG